MTFNRTVIAADLTIGSLIRDVLPVTSWYVDILMEDATRRKWDDDELVSRSERLELPGAGVLWQDLMPAMEGGYEHRRLLPLIRMVGVIGVFQQGRRKRSTLERRLMAVAGTESHATRASCPPHSRGTVGVRDLQMRPPWVTGSPSSTEAPGPFIMTCSPIA